MATMPKRRKSKDNPYLLNYDEKNDTYMVVFKNTRKEVSKVSITEKLYDVFNEFELNDLSQLNEFDRHIEHSELMDETLYKRATNYQESVEDIVENNILLEKLRNILNTLPAIQKRRLIKYYFEDKTYEQIAKEENCTKSAVKFSIDIAIDKISKNLKN